MRRRVLAILLAGLVTAAAIPAFATPISVITIDENRNGFANGVPLPSSFTTDPGPGGLSGVLTYALPFSGVQGDVFLTDADFFDAVLDVLRFNGDGTVIFYSDDIDGLDSLADTTDFPGAIYANNVFLDEIGSETDNGAFYTPSPGQPGFDTNATYTFISDGAGPTAVPEPATLVLLGTGLLGLGGLLRRKKLRS